MAKGALNQTGREKHSCVFWCLGSVSNAFFRLSEKGRRRVDEMCVKGPFLQSRFHCQFVWSHSLRCFLHFSMQFFPLNYVMSVHAGLDLSILGTSQLDWKFTCPNWNMIVIFEKKCPPASRAVWYLWNLWYLPTMNITHQWAGANTQPCVCVHRCLTLHSWNH